MGENPYQGPLERVEDCVWRIPRWYKHGMRVDGLLFASDAMIEAVREDQAPEQVANVATLPGIQGASLAMPDIHWGYGFPIGGVCATDADEGGVISPGGVGYDINCGVRLLRSRLDADDAFRGRLDLLMKTLFRRVPAGTGQGGSFQFNKKEMRRILAEGPRALQDIADVTREDLTHAEAGACLEGADPAAVSDKALERGFDQCGSLGSGNHFLEVQEVAEVHDPAAAAAFGLRQGGVCVLIHSGSRGLGHQVCDDTLRQFRDAPDRYGFQLPDRQLACAPIGSPEGRRYIAAMRAAANFAWCNRQLLTHHVRGAFEEVFGRPWTELGLSLVYDVCHNIAKEETHTIDGKARKVWVHRKGATRAFPPGHPEVPDVYRKHGQPVIIPGDMARASFVLAGQPRSMELSFGSSCHGAGRRLSRKAATAAAHGRNIDQEMRAKGVIALGHSRKGLAEEAPEAYKDVHDVVDVVERLGITKKVVRLKPLGVVKG